MNIGKFIMIKFSYAKKKYDIFLIFAQNIDWGYTLEPPVLTCTHNLCFKNVYPFKLPFYYIKEVKRIVNSLGPADIVGGTTGMLSRELYEYSYVHYDKIFICKNI